MSFGQGGPSWGSGGPQEPFGSNTPDWAALADASAARNRRKKFLWIGGGALATAAIVGIVATAIVSTNSGNSRNDKAATELPAPEELPSNTAQPGPSFSSVAPPPPPDPHDFISSSKKDKAPLSAAGLYPGKKLTMGDRVYAKGPTSRTTGCSSATQGALGAVLANNGCAQVIRATYTREGVAVTVGVAVFDTEAQAEKAKEQASGGLASLSGSGVPTFCRGGAVCRKTTNSYGRYAYFTVGGFTNGKNVTKGDSAVFQAGDDLAEFTFQQIVQRGRSQASAAAGSSAG
ncbi:hypothetical protein [Streptomyces sp. NPDC051219]|uniref:hypothetical protein n=1 Tax=Streptomyces sp. NPDC051219 TaxID=3155283 RepID=UPI00341AC99B